MKCSMIVFAAVREQAMKFYWRLKKYEDLDLSPEQIEAMQQHNHILIEELAEYEQLKKQGLLLKLPCKVGTPVWTIMCGMTGKNPTLFRQDFELAMIQYWNEAVFLTKKEAEAKIKEMEKKQ